MIMVKVNSTAKSLNPLAIVIHTRICTYICLLCNRFTNKKNHVQRPRA